MEKLESKEKSRWVAEYIERRNDNGTLEVMAYSGTMKVREDWKLLEKFVREGCGIVRTTLWRDEFQEHGKRIKLSLYDVVRVGHIYDSNIVEELKMVDKKS